MPYAVQIHDSDGQPLGGRVECLSYKSALSAAQMADKRTCGHTDIYAPSGQFITSTKAEDTQEVAIDDRD